MSEGLKKWMQDNKNKKYVYLILGLIMLVLIITFLPLDGKGSNPVQTIIKEPITNDNENYEALLEKKLTGMLSKMEGVGEVSVMITTVSNEEKVLAKDCSSNVQQTEEKDQSGGTRKSENTSSTQNVVLQSGNTPYVVKEYTPVIKGVFILAQGAANSEVKAQITDAVAKLLDVPVHKISVEKRK